MNYLERLVRRALLEAPARPGAALWDPFAVEAPWPLTAPAAAPVHAGVETGVPAAADLLVPPGPLPADGSSGEPVAGIPPPAFQLAAEVAGPVAPPARLAAVLPQPEHALWPATWPIAPTTLPPLDDSPAPPSALALADGFMRALTGPLPAMDLPVPAAPSITPHVDKASAALPVEPPWQQVPPVRLGPPAGPAPLPPDAPSASASATSTPAMVAAAPAQATSARVQARPMQVVTVVAAMPAAGAPLSAGGRAGTHRFGLGQL